jgi:hypothetical protein
VLVIPRRQQSCLLMTHHTSTPFITGSNQKTKPVNRASQRQPLIVKE